jgi:hypothetical protein
MNPFGPPAGVDKNFDQKGYQGGEELNAAYALYDQEMTGQHWGYAAHSPERRAGRQGFTSQDSAARAALEESWMAAIYTGWEYGGKIYTTDDCYGYTEPYTDRDAGFVLVKPIPVPNGTTTTAAYHTHPAAGGFSGPDWNQARKWGKDYGWDYYMGNSKGEIYKYEARTDKCSQIPGFKFPPSP